MPEFIRHDINSGGARMSASSRHSHVLWFLAILAGLGAWQGACSPLRAADDFLKVPDVELQPLVAATERLIEALDYVGAPLPADEREALKAALKGTDAGK